MTAKHWLIADEKANNLCDNYFMSSFTQKH